ncbi:hypothetical protein WMF11_38810 [Sorangium sp. So ce295]|uniref:hypothetical protein n=1 Tax=Sorangium sp. So ce295 TaxID=3133295 RepID=UPI003F640EDD
MSLIRSSVRLMGFAALCASLFGTTSCSRWLDDGAGSGAEGGGGSDASGSTGISGSAISGSGATSGSGGSGATSGSGGSGATSGGGGSGTGGAGVGGAATGGGGEPVCADDAYEANDASASAAPLAYDHTDDSLGPSAWFSKIDFVLCQGDEDWYLLDTTSLGIEEVNWSLRVLASGAGLCGSGCEQYTPPPGPENTLIVEVYSAATMELLGAEESDHGRVWLDGGGADSANDLLLRVYGPPEASYPYDMSFVAKSYEGEDECEC